MVQTDKASSPTAAASAGKGAGKGDGKATYYSVKDVQARNGADGSFWTVVNNKVYDITDFIPKHPGGDIVKYCAGRDGSDLLESYHPAAGQAKALAMLDRYYIGELADALPRPDDAFFVTVRARAEAALKARGWGRHFYEVIGVGEVVLTVLLYLYGTWCIARDQSYWWALMVGIATARLGFMMHMGNHRAVSSVAWINACVEQVMDLIGGSSKIWTHEHAVAHHLTPNQLWADNDCSIASPWLRFHPDLPWKPWHRLQAVATPIAMTVGTLKWYFSDVMDHLAGRVGSQQFHVSSADWTRLIGFKALWFVLHVALPWGISGGSLSFALSSAFLLMAVSSQYLENVFIVNHVQDGLVPRADLHWAQKQVIGSADWASGSHAWNWFSGGLNHQVVHHLFPSVSHYCYPILAPIVAETCKEFGLPYITFDSGAQAYWAMLTYLHRLGKPPQDPQHLSAANTVYQAPKPVAAAKPGKAKSN